MSKDKCPKGIVCICDKEIVTFKEEIFDDKRDKVICNKCGTSYMPRYSGATEAPVIRRIGEESWTLFEGEIIYD
jgi:hypothetical protein